jgi:hypothetical protein
LDPYDPLPVDIMLRGQPPGEPTQLRVDDKNAKPDTLLLNGRTPSSTDLAAHPESPNYIDIPKISPELLSGASRHISPPDRAVCARYVARYRKLASRFGLTTYARLSVAQSGLPIKSCKQRHPLRISYWFFYYFDNWIGNRLYKGNRHEGDWEHIEIFFDQTSIDDILTSNREPVELRYAQHMGGTCRPWTDGPVGKEGLHPVVYVARGSHASYFQPGGYRQSLHHVPVLLRDFAPMQAESRRVDPAVVLLPSCDDPATLSGSFAWMRFKGRWGEELDSDDGKADSFSGPQFGGRCG